MLEINQRYITYLVAIIVAILCIWIGVTGRLGSLLGAIITPGFMTQGSTGNGVGASVINGSSANFGVTLTDAQIAQAAVTAGVVGSKNAIATATAIAIAESGGDPQAHNPGNATDKEDSYGLWQINILAHPNYNKVRLYDPNYNAQAMYAISSGGVNWNPWGTYTSGKYKQFMSRGQAAANQVFQGI